MSDRVLLLTDARMDRHAAAGHPERPERREAVAAGVRDAAGGALSERRPRAIDEQALQRIHPTSHLAALREVEERGGGWLDPDTYVVPGSLEAALVAAGATLDAAEAVANGSATLAFAVVRPPGHHASQVGATGFCLLNNVAVAVAGLRAGGLRRVAIVDWDAHHGSGTQAIFDADPELCYASTHQVRLYPGTGAPWERGSGAAEGTKHNHQLTPGSGDDAFVAAWQDELLPAIESFVPDAILVSAGYDAHRSDPLAHLEVTESGFQAVARSLGALTARLGLPGVGLTLEGGYDLAALRASAAATVDGFLGGLARRESA